jgi:hypothetical protein
MRCALAVLSLCFLAGTAAAGNYDERINAMRSEIEKSTLPPAVRQTALANLATYADYREKALEKMVQLFANAEEFKNPAIWLVAVGDGAVSPARLAVNIPEKLDDEAGKAGLETLRTLIEQENSFWATIKNHNVVSHVALLVKIGQGMAERAKALEATWEKLYANLDEELDRQIFGAEAEVLAALKELDGELEKAIKEVNLRTTELMQKAGKAIGHLPLTEAQILGKGLEYSAKLIQRLLINRLQALRQKITPLVMSESNIAIPFVEVRKDTEEFLRTGGLEQAKIAGSAAQLAAGTMCGEMKPAGQEADCRKAAARMMEHKDKHLAAVEAISNAFFAKNRGKFFGPVEAKTVEDLLELDTTRGWANEASQPYARTGKMVQDHLNDYYRRPFWEDAPDEVRQAMKDYFEALWTEAARSYAQAHELHYREDWIDKIIEIKQEHAKKLE